VIRFIQPTGTLEVMPGFGSVSLKNKHLDGVGTSRRLESKSTIQQLRANGDVSSFSLNSLLVFMLALLLTFKEWI
jgi:hypothetical protein